MLGWTLRSALVLSGTALAGSVIVFLLLNVLGGDVAHLLLGNHATPESLATLRAKYGLDLPMWSQYINWLSGIVQGDLGTSYAAKYNIFTEITKRVPLTLGLAMGSLVPSSIAALIIGSYSAVHTGRLRSSVLDILTQLGIAIPAFWSGLMLIAFVSIRLGWLPAGGYVPWSQSAMGAMKSLLLPILAMSVPMTAILTRYVRSVMLDVLGEDYIRTAMAKGRTLAGAIRAHGLRNVSIALVTVTTLQFGALIAGAVVIEVVFNLPGLGRMLIGAVALREVIVVQSLVFVILLLILLMNFVMDIVYALLDPRIRVRSVRPRPVRTPRSWKRAPAT